MVVDFQGIYIYHLLMAGVNVLHIILYMYIPLVDGKAWGFSITTSPENYTMFICVHIIETPRMSAWKAFFFSKKNMGASFWFWKKKNKP